MKLPPASLVVGHRTLALAFVAEDKLTKGERGQYDPAAATIFVAADLSLPDQAETALHEILHGCFPTFDLPTDDDAREEIIVSIMAMTLAQTLRDNPAFFAWAEEALRIKSVLKHSTVAAKSRKKSSRRPRNSFK